jgi:phosphatidylglycerophosphate synthase
MENAGMENAGMDKAGMDKAGLDTAGLEKPYRDNTDLFQTHYRSWAYAQSLVVVALFVLASPVSPLAPSRAAFFLALWGSAMMSVLALLGAQARGAPVRLFPADALTALRSAAGVGVFLLIGLHGGRSGEVSAAGIGPFLPGPAMAWIAVIVLGMVELTDFFDGRLARHRGTTSFGAVWDMENDAFFALALSFAAWQIAGIPIVVLLIGLMRYLYLLAFRVEGDPPGDNPLYKKFARSTTATLMIALIVIYAPILPHGVRGAIVYGALGMQVASFTWDLLLRFRAGRAVSDMVVLPSGRRRH